jgi:hypothetical protein
MLKVSDVVGVAGFNFRITSTESTKKKGGHQEPGTTKLNNEELKRLEQRMAQVGSSPASPKAGPVVQVTALPDEYTHVAEEEDE